MVIDGTGSSEPGHPLAVLHVTEASAAGVLSSIATLCRAQVAEGWDVSFAHTRRPDTPPDSELEEVLPGVDRTYLVYGRHGPLGVVSLMRQLRKIVRADKPDVVHLHSTVAGLAGRLLVATRQVPRHVTVVYTPHGFSFLREDVSRAVSFGMLVIEAALARVGDGLILVSDSERDVAVSRLRAPRVDVVHNSINAESLPRRQSRTRPRPVIVTLGRITYAKAPWRFARLARRFGDQADFVWIGDGPAEDRRGWLNDAPVTVTGWLSSDDVHARLLDADLFLLPSLWEGMPIGLLEAQAIGLPAIATAVVGCRDVIQPGITGILIDREDELDDAVAALLGDPDLRERMGASAAESTRSRFGDAGLAHASRKAYGRHAATKLDSWHDGKGTAHGQ